MPPFSSIARSTSYPILSIPKNNVQAKLRRSESDRLVNRGRLCTNSSQSSGSTFLIEDSSNTIANARKSERPTKKNVIRRIIDCISEIINQAIENIKKFFRPYLQSNNSKTEKTITAKTEKTITEMAINSLLIKDDLDYSNLNKLAQKYFDIPDVLGGQQKKKKVWEKIFVRVFSQSELKSSFYKEQPLEKNDPFVLKNKFLLLTTLTTQLSIFSSDEVEINMAHILDAASTLPALPYIVDLLKAIFAKIGCISNINARPAFAKCCLNIIANLSDEKLKAEILPSIYRMPLYLPQNEQLAMAKYWLGIIKNLSDEKLKAEMLPSVYCTDWYIPYDELLDHCLDVIDETLSAPTLKAKVLPSILGVISKVDHKLMSSLALVNRCFNMVVEDLSDPRLKAEVLPSLCRAISSVNKNERLALVNRCFNMVVEDLSDPRLKAEVLPSLGRAISSVNENERLALVNRYFDMVVEDLSDPRLKAEVLPSLGSAISSVNENERLALANRYFNMVVEDLSPTLQAEVFPSLCSVIRSVNENKRRALLNRCYNLAVELTSLLYTTRN